MSRPQHIHVQEGPAGPGQSFVADSRLPLTSQLASAGLPLDTRCGGQGTCRSCEIFVKAGRVMTDTGEAGPASLIQACRSRPLPGEDLLLEIPARSRLQGNPHCATAFQTARSPRLTQPAKALHRSQLLGLAIDLGTTTVAVMLVDLRSGAILSLSSGYNRQIPFGDDVITRIQHCTKPDGLTELRHAVRALTLAPLIAEACTTAQACPSDIVSACIAGNTTMLHLLAGEDPTSLGRVPFTAKFLGELQLPASSLQLDRGPDGAALLSPDTPVILMPGISAYAGADLVSGIVCTGLDLQEGPSLLLDLGTNGEIALVHGQRILACATATGPAFEGARLASGTRAAPGAVCNIRIPETLWPMELDQIKGGSRATGLCGTAYVDFMAEGRRRGLIDEGGHFTELAASQIPAPCLRVGPYGKELLLPGDLCIREADLSILMQAKAAVAAGVSSLLQRCELRPCDVRRVLIAGGFGMSIDPANTIACGMLPGFSTAQVSCVGNTALGGAWLALCDKTLLELAGRLATSANTLELNLEPGFEDCYIDHLRLP